MIGKRPNKHGCITISPKQFQDGGLVRNRKIAFCHKTDKRFVIKTMSKVTEEDVVDYVSTIDDFYRISIPPELLETFSYFVPSVVGNEVNIRGVN